MTDELEAIRDERRDVELLTLCDRAVDFARTLPGNPEHIRLALSYAGELAAAGELRRPPKY